MAKMMVATVRRVLPLIACVILPAFSACTSAEEKERRRTAAMVEQAKADAAAESVFVQDSIKLAASITLDTVEAVVPQPRGATDADGNKWADTIYKALTLRGASCIVDSLKSKTLVKGDTLSCQWEKPQ